MGHDDELGPLRVAAQQLDEAPDVGVVEGRLDLVQEIERARPGEEEREQERDRSERLLTAGQERQACDALPDRAQLDLDAGLRVGCFVVRFGKP